MKRYLILATAAIVALASCSKTRMVYEGASDEISFKAVTGAMTKATSALDTYHESMGVFANYSADNSSYFANAKYVNHTSHWGGVITHYYPMSESLDFLYYAPYLEGWTATYDAAAETATLASPALAAENIKDLLYGKAVLAGVEKTDKPLPVTLAHATAKITINVKANTADLITFNSVSITNVSQGGKLTVTYSLKAGEEGKVVSSVWSDKAAAASATLTSAATLGTTESQYGEPVYIVPSNLGEKNVEQTTIKVIYSVKDNALLTNKEVEVDLSPDAAKTYWEMGKHYIYNFSASVYAIQFTPVVEDMVDEEAKDTVNGEDIWTEVE